MAGVDHGAHHGLGAGSVVDHDGIDRAALNRVIDHDDGNVDGLEKFQVFGIDLGKKNHQAVDKTALEKADLLFEHLHVAVEVDKEGRVALLLKGSLQVADARAHKHVCRAGDQHADGVGSLRGEGAADEVGVVVELLDGARDRVGIVFPNLDAVKKPGNRAD